MKCERCRFAPPVEADGYQDECIYFEKYGITWKDGQEGCTLTHAQLKKYEDEYDEYLGNMGTDMGLEMDFEQKGLDLGKAVDLCRHMIGMDNRRTYIRHGKKFYKPYRNYFCGYQKELHVLARHRICEEIPDKYTLYKLTRSGFGWLERQLKIRITLADLDPGDKENEK